jgi:hypothetical protein
MFYNICKVRGRSGATFYKVKTSTDTNEVHTRYNLYYRRDVPHRYIGPAETTYDENNNFLIHYKVWKVNGKRHRFFCVAYISYNFDGSEKTKEYWDSNYY